MSNPEAKVMMFNYGNARAKPGIVIPRRKAYDVVLLTDMGIKKIRLPLDTKMEQCMYKGKPYTVSRCARSFRASGKVSGITKGALKVIREATKKV